MPKSNLERRSVQRLEQLKKKVVRMRQNGAKIDVIAKECGLSRTTVIATCKAYGNGGWEALKAKRRGRPAHSGRAMSQPQEAKVIKVMLEKTPEDLSMPGRLWTSAAVGKLVFDLCGVQLTNRAIRNYLERWGLNSGRFSNKDLRQMSGQQKIWFEAMYPTVQIKAYLDGCSIYFLNLVTLRRGVVIDAADSLSKPLVASTHAAKAKQLSLLRALSSQGHMKWKLYPGGFTTTILKDFCDQLHCDADVKILIVLERSIQSLSVRVQTWLSRRKGKIQFEYLPRLGN